MIIAAQGCGMPPKPFRLLHDKHVFDGSRPRRVRESIAALGGANLTTNQLHVYLTAGIYLCK